MGAPNREGIAGGANNVASILATFDVPEEFPSETLLGVFGEVIPDERFFREEQQVEKLYQAPR